MPECNESSAARVRGWWFRRRHAPLLDALRRSTELLQGADTPSATTFAPYHAEEVAHILAVNRRLLRHYDPAETTDRKAV